MQLIEPFPHACLGEAWGWLQQFPRANFDDFGPRTLDAWISEIASRHARGERTWGVAHEARLVGMIGYCPIAPFAGSFHGICFDRSVHGTGVPRAAVNAVLEQVFSTGTEKIIASYFADNRRIHVFLKRLGAVPEGYLRAQTRRNGEPVDVRLAAFYRAQKG